MAIFNNKLLVYQRVSHPPQVTPGSQVDVKGHPKLLKVKEAVERVGTRIGGFLAMEKDRCLKYQDRFSYI